MYLIVCIYSTNVVFLYIFIFYQNNKMASKKRKIVFSKTDIVSAIGGLTRDLESLLSDETKQKVNFKKGRQNFKDLEVFAIYKDLFPLKNDSEIKELIRY